MKTILCSIALLSLSLPAFAANHFVCYKRTGKTGHESTSSAILVPIARDLDSGAVLSYTDNSNRATRTFKFKDKKTEPRTGLEWTHLSQVDPLESPLSTMISIHSSGLNRMMSMVTMKGPLFVSAENYFCEEESSI